MRNLICIFGLGMVVAFGGSTEAGQSPRFQDFAVTNGFKGKPATVDLKSHPKARMYRSQLTRQAANGPNFAGHYKIATWGCGTSCSALAIVDSQSGKVYFPPELSYATWEGYKGTNVGFQYRLDSRLLILRGTREEKLEAGDFYYIWQTNTLRLVRAELQK